MQTIFITFLIQHISHTLSSSNASTSSPYQETTSSLTSNTNNLRTILNCNYGIIKVEDLYEIYSLDKCYDIYATSRQYQCKDSIIYHLDYINDICDGTAILDEPILPTTPCYNQSDTNQCGKTITLHKYNRDPYVDECYRDMLNWEPIDSVSFILNHCIPTRDNTYAIYNEFDAKSMSLIQYQYNTMDECRNASLLYNSVQIDITYCSSTFYYELEIPSMTQDPTSDPTTEPTTEPTLEPIETLTLSSNTTAFPTSEPTVEPTMSNTIVYNQSISTPEPTTEPTLEPTVSNISIHWNETVSSTEPTSEPTIEPTTEPTIEPSIRDTHGRDVIPCNYGIFDDGIWFETIPINQCYVIGDTSNLYQCINGSIMQLNWNNDEYCNTSDYSIKALHHITAQCDVDITNTNECEFKMIRRYNRSRTGICGKSDGERSFIDSIPFIINHCIPTTNGSVVFNAYNPNDMIQYVYDNIDDCFDHNPHYDIQLDPSYCKTKWYFELEQNNTLTPFPTTEPTMEPTVEYISTSETSTTEAIFSTSNAPSTPPTFKGELDCNYGLLVPDPEDTDHIFYETFVMNHCYDGTDKYDIYNIDSYRYLCIEGVMYQQSFYDDVCGSVPDNEQRVSLIFNDEMEEYCKYNDNITDNECEFIWIKQYYSHHSRCEPNGLIRRMAFVTGQCITFSKSGDVIRNDFDEDKAILTQFYYINYFDCITDSFGQYYEYHLVIVDKDCPDSNPYYFEIEIPELPTSEPTPPPTLNYTTNSPTKPPIVGGELECNYGVNYTENEFYKTYIVDTCYNLDLLDRSFNIECIDNDMVVHEWHNEDCLGTASNYTTSTDITTINCNPSNMDKACDFVWLYQYEPHSGMCKPHTHSLKKFAMIIDTCVVFEEDDTSFRNKYFIDENFIPQLVQFQYNDLYECIQDTDNIESGGVPSTFKVWHVADGHCEFSGLKEYFYEIKHPETPITPITTQIQSLNTTEIQSIHTTYAQTIVESTIHRNVTRETTPSVQTTLSVVTNTTSATQPITTQQPITTITRTEAATTAIPSAAPTEATHVLDICNYMIGEDSSSGFYSTLIDRYCYAYDLGSKVYTCTDGVFVEMAWFAERGGVCDGKPNHNAKATDGESYCISTNNVVCKVIVVSQYTAEGRDVNCTKLMFVQQYTFIINVCLEYNAKDIYIYNEYDERNPDRIKQIHYRSYGDCINAEFGEEVEFVRSIEIIHKQCIEDYYYDIESMPKEATPNPTQRMQSTESAESSVTQYVEPYYKKIYQSIFGPKGPTRVEFDVLFLVMIIIFGCLFCGILMWCGWLKGCTDLCWNVLCCGRYSRLGEDGAEANADDGDMDTGDDSVEMGNIAHILVPDDNMELAALSGHDHDNNLQRKRNRVRKPDKANRL